MINIKELQVGSFVKCIPTGRKYKVKLVTIEQANRSTFLIQVRRNEVHCVFAKDFDDFEIVKNVKKEGQWKKER